MKNYPQDFPKARSRQSWSQRLVYVSMLAGALTIASCDNSSETETAAGKLHKAEKEYRKASKDKERATKRFEDANKALKEAKENYQKKSK